MRAALLLSLLALTGCSEFFLPSGDLPDGWLVDGDLRFIDPPDRVSEGDLEANGVIFAFDEGVGRFWDVDWEARPEDHSIVPVPGVHTADSRHRISHAGVGDLDLPLIEDRSIYIHFDPRGQGVEVQAAGHIRFDTPITNIVLTDAGMDVSDEVYRVPTTVYPRHDYPNRGMILDEGEGNEQIVIDDDGMGLSFNLETSGLDSARVLLEPESGGAEPTRPIGDLTHGLASQALVLGIEASEVDLPEAFREGVGASVFLADAAEVADLVNAPISGAEVAIQGTTIPDQSSGAYELEPGELAYQTNGTWTLTVGLGEDTATASIELPPGAANALPDTHQPNQSLAIDLSSLGYGGALAVVIDNEGHIVYDNRPQDIRELYDLPRGDTAGTIVIDAEAFPRVGSYVVGVAGIESTPVPEHSEGMNTTLSTMMAGKMVFERLQVAD